GPARQTAKVRDWQPALFAGAVGKEQHQEQSNDVDNHHPQQGRIQTTFHNHYSCRSAPNRRGAFTNLKCNLHLQQAAQRALAAYLSQITGTGNVSVNFFKFKARASRSSCRSMPQQCGTSRGASSTSSGSEVLQVPITSSAAIPM